MTVFFACLAGAFAAYLVALALLRRGAPRLVAVGALAVAIQLLPLAAPVLLSTDAWAYWEYGEIAEAGQNPYRDTPSEVPQNPAYEHAGFDWRDTISVYGPVFTVVSEGVAAVSGSSEQAAAWTFKVVAALSMLVLTWLAARLSSSPVYAAAFVGWNPLLAVHFAGGGHNDALMLALVLGALAFAAAGRRIAAAVAWALSIFIKWVPIVFFALRAIHARAVRRPVSHAGFAITVVAVALVATWRYGVDWLRAFGPLARNAGGQTSYAIPQRLEDLGVPHAVALGLADGRARARARLAGPRGAPRPRPARARRLPAAPDDPLARAVVRGLGRPARRRRGRPPRPARLARPLRVPAAADVPL